MGLEKVPGDHDGNHIRFDKRLICVLACDHHASRETIDLFPREALESGFGMHLARLLDTAAPTP
jgi:hypothetical protein